MMQLLLGLTRGMLLLFSVIFLGPRSLKGTYIKLIYEVRYL